MPHLLPAGIDDARTLGQKFRRVELQQILDKEKIKYAPNTPKESLTGGSLLDVVMANGIDLNKYITPQGEFTLSGSKVSAPMNQIDQLKAMVESQARQIAELQGKAPKKAPKAD